MRKIISLFFIAVCCSIGLSAQSPARSIELHYVDGTLCRLAMESNLTVSVDGEGKLLFTGVSGQYVVPMRDVAYWCHSSLRGEQLEAGVEDIFQDTVTVLSVGRNITVSGLDGSMTVLLYDLNGVSIAGQSDGNAIVFSGLTPGVYILSVQVDKAPGITVLKVNVK